MTQKICVLKGDLKYDNPTGPNGEYVQKTEIYYGIAPKTEITKPGNLFQFKIYGIPVEFQVILGGNKELLLPENGMKKLRGKSFNNLQGLVSELEKCDKDDRGLNNDLYKKIINSINQGQHKNN